MTTPDDVLKGLYDETLVGNAPRVLDLTHEALGMQMEPQSLLFDALIPSHEISAETEGRKLKRGDALSAMIDRALRIVTLGGLLSIRGIIWYFSRGAAVSISSRG